MVHCRGHIQKLIDLACGVHQGQTCDLEPDHCQTTGTRRHVHRASTGGAEIHCLPLQATGKTEISLSANIISAPWVQYKLVSYLWCHFLLIPMCPGPSGINSFRIGPNRKTVLKAHRHDLQCISTLYPKRYMTESRVSNTAKCKE